MIEAAGRERFLRETYERNLPRLQMAAATVAERETNLALTDAWVGEWTGPEGTQLVIAGADGKYEAELIRATDGPGTGMKWLQEKQQCLVIRQSEEGFCRD